MGTWNDSDGDQLCTALRPPALADSHNRDEIQPPQPQRHAMVVIECQLVCSKSHQRTGKMSVFYSVNCLTCHSFIHSQSRNGLIFCLVRHKHVHKHYLAKGN